MKPGPQPSSAPAEVEAPGAANASRALLKGIPYIGASLDQFIFGRLDELRLRRIEATLAEVAETLHRREDQPNIESEQFVNLLESVLPALARATNEDKRQRLRDLLLNVASTPHDDAAWSEAELASKLVVELEGPALAIIAALARYSGAQPVAIVSRPVTQIVSEESFNWDSPTEGDIIIPYPWPVAEECCRRLREGRLIGFSSHDARGGFGGMHLTDLGQVLIRWAIADVRAAV